MTFCSQNKNFIKKLTFCSEEKAVTDVAVQGNTDDHLRVLPMVRTVWIWKTIRVGRFQIAGNGFTETSSYLDKNNWFTKGNQHILWIIFPFKSVTTTRLSTSTSASTKKIQVLLIALLRNNLSPYCELKIVFQSSDMINIKDISFIF